MKTASKLIFLFCIIFASFSPSGAEQAASTSTLSTLTQEAAKGDTTAQYDLGAMHLNGDGVELDLIKARQLFAQAAAQFCPGRASK